MDVTNAKEYDYGRTWFHGSPFKLTTLRRGSIITKDVNAARIFSHKPTLVSISENGFKHDGKKLGFLYHITEDIKPEDVYVHPRSCMEKGKEWLTNRELRVELIGSTKIIDEERLTGKEILVLKNTVKKK